MNIEAFIEKVRKDFDKIDGTIPRLSYLVEVMYYLSSKPGILGVDIGEEFLVYTQFKSWLDEKLIELEVRVILDDNPGFLLLKDAYKRIIGCRDFNDLKKKYGGFNENIKSTIESLANDTEANIEAKLKLNNTLLTTNGPLPYSKIERKSIFRQYREYGYRSEITATNPSIDDLIRNIDTDFHSTDFFSQEELQCIYYHLLIEVAEGATLAQQCLLLEQRRKLTSVKSSSISQNSFEVYLTEEGKTKYPGLIREYGNKKFRPIEYAYMLFALEELQLLYPSLDKINQSDLARVMKATFGNIGTRANLNIHLSKYPQYYQRTKVDQHKKAIKAL
jgi:hypothetical protein